MSKVELPQRATRGKRFKAVLEDEVEADNEFWNQEFFKDEAEADVDYKSEAEEEDVVDSDFDEPEEEGETDDEADVEEKPRKKALKPPGAPKAAPSKPKTDKALAAAAAERAAKRQAVADQKPVEVTYRMPTLRRSTMARVAEAEQERWEREQNKPRKRIVKDDQWRPLTQQELLAEAALTEVENLQSLKLLLAQEEETRRKAIVVKKKYAGPLVKFHSKMEGEGERTVFEVCNMHHPPPWLRHARAPMPAAQPVCTITGKLAKYRDPRTGQAFADAAAFRRLRGLPATATAAGTSYRGSSMAAAAGASFAGKPVAFGGLQLPIAAQASGLEWTAGAVAGADATAKAGYVPPHMLATAQPPGLAAASGMPKGAAMPAAQTTAAASSTPHADAARQPRVLPDPPMAAPGELPPHLMALVVDLHTQLGLAQA